MRRHERFDTSIPIQFQKSDIQTQLPSALINISLGGLSFSLAEPITIGNTVNISIDHVVPPVQLKGTIRWCRKFTEQYEVGLEFNDLDDPFLSRMLRQVCEIEKYRTNQLQQHNRELTSQQAAEEWIKDYAADFM